MIPLEHVDVYINNVCNRTCEGCVTYSNFAFSGHYDFKNSKALLEGWSEKLDFGIVNVLGGEPLLHPELLNWVAGVKNIFKNTKTFVLTTGMGVSQIENKIDVLEQILDLGFLIDINVHDRTFYQETINFVETQLLKNLKFTKISQSIDGQMYLRNEPEPINYLENNLAKVRITSAWTFMNNNVKEFKDNAVHFYKSDPQLAFDNCPFKPNIALLEGRLYKCPSLVTLQNFSKQIKCEDQELIDSINSISPYDTDEKIEEYIKSLKYPVEQCKLCPENRTVSVLSNNIKKVKIVKKHEN